MTHRYEPTVTLGEEVAEALVTGTAVVALESTIFSTLGLPAPANGEALERCKAVITDRGAVPAVAAVLDGVWTLGLDPAGEDRILTGNRKVAERDLAVAAAQRWDVGVTTVSATLALCDLAGVEVFATGGIGGVHRGVELSGDVSADLDALANHRVVTVCAGAKAFLDLARTLEHLETYGVPVLGFRHADFPAFYLRSSGLPVPHRVEDAREVARVFANLPRPRTGVLLTTPIPVDAELDPEHLTGVLGDAVAAAESGGITGAAVTPYVLAAIAEATEGASIPANLALAENNAALAADVAVALTR